MIDGGDNNLACVIHIFDSIICMNYFKYTA